MDFRAALDGPRTQRSSAWAGLAVVAAVGLQHYQMASASNLARFLGTCGVLSAVTMVMPAKIRVGWGHIVQVTLTDIMQWFADRRKRQVKEERQRRERLWSQGQDSGVQRTVSPIRPPRFDSDDPALLAYLDEHGYAVVKDVLAPREVEEAKDHLWDFLESSVGMIRDDPATWMDENFRRVGDTVTGIVNGDCFGHSTFCWFVRQQPSVRKAFEKIWDTEALLTSFDGGNVFRPFHAAPAHIASGGGDGQKPGVAGNGGNSVQERQANHRHMLRGRISKTSGGWFHVDQGFEKSGKHCVQGLVSLYNASEFTGGLCVIPGSHRKHDELMMYAYAPADFVPLPRQDPLASDGKLVSCQAGDLILWDSRTVHCNTPALSDPSPVTGQPYDELLRAVCYTCFTPKARATSDVIANRRRAFVEGIGTNHWPHEFFPSGPFRDSQGLDDTRISTRPDGVSAEIWSLVG